MLWDGETPLEDREGLIDQTITTRRQLFDAEAENIRLTIVKYLGGKPTRRTAKFDSFWSLKLHREMFGNVWDWAGTIRERDNNIGIPFHLIGNSLATLFSDLNFWEHHHWPDVLEQAVRLHYQAVKIHPFRNGNGRWARMLASIWLKMHGQQLPDWPVEIGEETSSIRQEYLECLRQADASNFSPLYELHKKYLPE